MNYDGQLKYEHSYGTAIKHWDAKTQAFWKHHIDRYYHFFVVPQKLRQGRVLDIGAEYYNRYIKEVIARGSELTVIDIKEKDHPEIAKIVGLDYYHRIDFTQQLLESFDRLKGYFDTVLSFGVLSCYDMPYSRCENYLKNAWLLLREEGQAVFKFDIHRIQEHKSFPPFDTLMSLLQQQFLLEDVDTLISELKHYRIYYCRKRLKRPRESQK